jgi:hypothetical protein
VRALGELVGEVARALAAPADARLLALAADCARDAPPSAAEVLLRAQDIARGGAGARAAEDGEGAEVEGAMGSGARESTRE